MLKKAIRMIIIIDESQKKTKTKDLCHQAS